jgi:hypothetical protein
MSILQWIAKSMGNWDGGHRANFAKSKKIEE